VFDGKNKRGVSAFFFTFDPKLGQLFCNCGIIHVEVPDRGKLRAQAELCSYFQHGT